jgi:uncharacterized protein (DUF4415 family)
MKQKSSSRKSKSTSQRPQASKQAAVKVNAEHPELDVKHLVNGIVRRGLKVVPPKASVSLRIDADVLDWFRSSGSGYQTKINAVLRAFKEAAR